MNIIDVKSTSRRNTEDQEIVDDICDYASNIHLKELLQEYLRRVVTHKPDDLLRFLVDTITEDPYTPPK